MALGYFNFLASDYTEGVHLRKRVEQALLSSMALRHIRRLLTINAFVVVSVLPEVPFHVSAALIALALLELLVPAPRFVREAGFQDAIAMVCYATLPIFLVTYSLLRSADPLLDGLLSFLVIFHLKWLYAPRTDFHWLASLLLYAMVSMRDASLMFGVLFGSFALLSLLYLVGNQEMPQHTESERSYLGTLRRRRRARRRIYRWTIPLALFVVVTFYCFPRFSPPGGWGARKYTNVTDSMQLGDPGPLSLDPKVVAYVDLLEGEIDPSQFYLRTGHLDSILEDNWSFYWLDYGYAQEPSFRPRPDLRPRMAGAGVFRQGFRPRLQPPFDSRPIVFRLEFQDPDARFVALPFGTYEIELPVPGRLERIGADFFEYRRVEVPFAMVGRARSPAVSSELGWEVFPHIEPSFLTLGERRHLLHLPEPLRLPEFRSLAQSWTRGIPAYESRLRAAKIARTLGRTGYRYTLDPAMAPGTDNPIRDFLFDERYSEGYCEMFAASMVVLLRNIGIPARVAVGFAGAEVEPESGRLVVRRSRAHAWVEAYIVGEGWIGFDPTPAEVYQSYQNRESFKLAKTWFDKLRLAWSQAVVNYDHVRQEALVGAVGRLLRQWAAAIVRRIHATLSPFAWYSDQLGSQPALRFVFLMLMLAQGAAIVLYLLHRWKRSGRPIDPVARAGLFWRRVERAAERRLGERAPGETPRAYLARFAGQWPDAADAAIDAARYYEALLYAAATASVDEAGERRLIAALAAGRR